MKGQHDAVELLGILAQLPLRGQAHVHRTQDVLLKHLGWRSKGVVGEVGDLDRSVRPFLHRLDEHLDCDVPGM
jgi:hypothetical protein